MADWKVHNVMCTDKFEWMIIARMYSSKYEEEEEEEAGEGFERWFEWMKQ